ncbi:MAG: prepilin-type N-terminal cleavage/methylation domain-containing protein [Candidatus Berkiella sp.]
MKKYKGLTLVELILAMVVLSVGLSGVLSIMIFSVKNSVTPELRWQLIVIGENIVQSLLDQKEGVLPAQGTLQDLFPAFSAHIPNATQIKMQVTTQPYITDDSTLISVTLSHQALGDTQLSAIKYKTSQHE